MTSPAPINHKCSIVKTRLKYLSHLVEEEGNRPMPQHLQIIQDCPVPTTWKRPYVQYFAVITALLTEMLLPAKKYSWDTNMQNAFEEVPFPRVPRPHTNSHNPPSVFTNVSQEGIGAEHCVIDYSSAKLGNTTNHYDVNEREYLPILWAIKRYLVHLV
ncbi:hypothetical protein PR048_018618 [Dryococelus australis]|uniref:Reverse transcriptase RNase H-like domain-containing protein n=1 Tax=Dryococelus australis TaxID=614101 RepID=A0ABQ9HD19_9NEOP|nr:hypothetical protein PR048_018618 [Dryococelus australis]